VTSQEELSVGSVVYMGRGSFRMEAIGFETDRERGVAQPIQSTLGLVTAPYDADGRAVRGAGASFGAGAPFNDNDGTNVSGVSNVLGDLSPSGVARTRTVGAWQAPIVQPLFGSQDELTMLTAPIAVFSSRRSPLSLSRAAIAGLGAAVFACGLLAAGAARSLTVTGPSAALAATNEVVAPAPAKPVVIAPVAVVSATHESSPPAPAAVQVPAPPVKITAHKAPHAHRATAATPTTTTTTTTTMTTTTAATTAAPTHKPWVDPFAE
jgi:hypothetical protein